MKTIPTSNESHYSQTTQLSGQDFVFEFQWNARESAWYVDVADQDGVLIAVSRKMVVDYPLMPRCKDPRRPPGMLIVIDGSGQGLDPGRDDLLPEGRVSFIYTEPEDL